MSTEWEEELEVAVFWKVDHGPNFLRSVGGLLDADAIGRFLYPKTRLCGTRHSNPATTGLSLQARADSVEDNAL
jgi:hypothetical protein